jgi:hypothetical protein
MNAQDLIEIASPHAALADAKRELAAKDAEIARLEKLLINCDHYRCEYCGKVYPDTEISRRGDEYVCDSRECQRKADRADHEAARGEADDQYQYEHRHD